MDRTNRSSRCASASIEPAGRPDGVRGPVHGRIGQVPGSRPDARERGPHVVRDRVEQGALEGIAPTGDLGRRRLLAEPVTSKARARSGRRRARAAGSPPGPRSPSALARTAQSDPYTVPSVSTLIRKTCSSVAGRRRRLGRGVASCARTQRAGSSSGIRTRREDRRGRRQRPASPCPPRTWSRAPRSRPIQTRSTTASVASRPTIASTTGLGPLGGRQEPADREQPGRLGGPAVGFGGSRPPERRETPDDDRHEQDQHEVEQLVRVARRPARSAGS